MDILDPNMNKNLINLSADTLLKKFGSGGDIPGSGSATAHQGMMSAQLIRSAINLTNSQVRNNNYKNALPNLLKIDSEIESRIYPSLEKLFQEDSDQFDKVINLRKARDEETNALRKKDLNTEALRELKLATVIPIKIAELCIELANFAASVFDSGYIAVRGESAVALNNAVSAVAGCISIIDLNLLSFYSDEWTERIRAKKSRLNSSYENLSLIMTNRLEVLEAEAYQKTLFDFAIKEYRSDKWTKSNLSNLDIEDIAAQLQNIIWKYRSIIWKKGTPEEHIDILKPEIVLEKLLGYQFNRPTTLGQYEIQGRLIGVAGQIDRENKIVEISNEFSSEIQNFTAAHELGHALFHQQNGLHRDRALDGSDNPVTRDLQELQADKFATHFLMPRKIVESKFKDLFLPEKFKINEETVFALTSGNVSDFKMRYKSLRDLSRFLASTEYFNGKHFASMSKHFHVSIKAMAIRLEELELLEY